MNAGSKGKVAKEGSKHALNTGLKQGVAEMI